MAGYDWLEGISVSWAYGQQGTTDSWGSHTTAGTPRNSRLWGESKFLLLILSGGARGPSRDWHLLCPSHSLTSVFREVNIQYPFLGSERKFFPTDVSPQAGTHCQRLLPKKGYPDDELELGSPTFRNCPLLLRER